MIADEEVRERLVGELDRTFFVEAGAGTGKTTTLVGRIVNLVARGGVPMERLVAITFTEAAAAELRDRVREGLERAASDSRWTAAEQVRCQEAAGEIDLAAISTIHAFALSLLRTFPLEAGLPPSFGTLDEIEQGAAFEERWRAWFWREALAEPARRVLRRALLLGLTPDQLRALALELERHYDFLDSDTAWPSSDSVAALPVAHTQGRALEELDPLTAHALDGPEDVLAQEVARAQLLARRLRAAATEEQALAALQDAAGLKTRVGNTKRWGKLPDGRNACTVIKAVLGEARDASSQVVESHRAATFAAVLALLREFTLAGVAARKAEGQATFQDLLVWARDLLRDHADVRRRAQARYDRILVDEFQDTDPLQAEIAFYLAAEPDTPAPADWADLPLVPGKLFVVGDPKQSIYRFRRADIAVYDALLRRLRAAQERLVQNFRSVRPVLDWVNHHFAAEMIEEEGCQPPYVPLVPRWEAHPDAVCGVYHVGESLALGAPDVAAVEAQAIAALARAAVADGWRLAEDGTDDTRTLRPARYRDLAILLQSRTHLRRLERALEEAGVPYRLESGALLLGTQEVRDLLAGLRAIADPSDQVALVGALRSLAFACSDADLLRWVEGGGRLSHEDPGDGPAGPVKEALGCLADFHARRHSLSAPALIEAYIRERLLVAAAFGEPRPREAWRRLRYVVARARAFTATGRHTLRAFLDWMDGLARAEVRDAESAEAEPDEDALRILTVHGSKGLEFPVVFLAGLGSARRGRATGVDVLPDRDSGRLACRAGDWQTADFAAAKEREKAMEEAEALRLLYVAGTRARDHLVLSLYRGARTRSCPAVAIETRLTANAALSRALSPPLDDAPVTSTGPVSAGSVSSPDQPYDCDETAEQAWLEERRRLVERLAAPRTLVAADADWAAPWRTLDDEYDLVTGAPGDEDDPPESVLDGGDEPAARAPAHGAWAVRALLRRARDGTLEPSPVDDPVAVARARAILASAAYRRAIQSGTCRRAVPLLARVEGILLELVADLVYETVEGVVLVRFDLDEPREAPAAGDPARSACWRAGLLALAFEGATGRPPHAVELIAADSGGVTRFEDVAGLIAAARSVVHQG